ncbi:MAG: hypothetical protein IIC99_01540 [Chloroflexi bacterium]|nr:hypothetical protein [Chloroflexota bacterium]
MNELYRRFKDQVEFFVVYVQEAHPTDGRQTDSNVELGILFRQHQSFEERDEVAATCTLDLHIEVPVLVEEMDNNVDEAYGAAPERLYLIDADGKVAYHGGAGPHFFDLDEWEEALQACVGVTA